MQCEIIYVHWYLFPCPTTALFTYIRLGTRVFNFCFVMQNGSHGEKLFHRLNQMVVNEQYWRVLFFFLPLFLSSHPTPKCSPPLSYSPTTYPSNDHIPPVPTPRLSTRIHPWLPPQLGSLLGRPILPPLSFPIFSYPPTTSSIFLNCSNLIKFHSKVWSSMFFLSLPPAILW